MKNIPIEILNQIFDLLSQEDHMECMIVCHLWKVVIENHSLFRDLRIYSTESFKSVLKKIKNNPVIGRNVNQLIFHFEDHKEFNLTELLEPLCNLRTFHCYPDFKKLLMDDGISFSWRTSIETFSQRFFSPIILPTLAINIFPRLTILDVGDYADNTLLHCLKNAPALKSLTLRFGKFSFDGLDTLHETLPNLNILTLKYKSALDDTFYKYIVPAKSMTELNLVSIATGTIQQRIDILRYIKIKYPNLVHIKLDEDFFGISNSETERLYDQGWGPLLHYLGSQLKELQVYYLLEAQGFLDMLDINHCQIQTLYITALSLHPAFPRISQSQQALHIKNLELDQIQFKSLVWLKELKALESINIAIDRYAEPLPFNFNKFIENCPESLSSLSLANVKLTAELINAIQCNVEALTLAYCDLPQKIDWFIHRHFPLLSAFTLKNCKFFVKKFDVKAIDLQTFCLIQNGCKETITVLVKTYCDFEERLYSTRGIEAYYPFHNQYTYFDPTDYPPVRSSPASETKEKPFITLYCHTMRQIFLCH